MAALIPCWLPWTTWPQEHIPNPVTFWVSYWTDFTAICIEWAVGLVLGSSQALSSVNHSQGHFPKREVGERYGSIFWQHQLPQDRGREVKLPTHGDALGAAGREAMAAAQAAAERLARAAFMESSEESMATFFSPCPFLPLMPPAHLYRSAACKAPDGAKWQGSFFIVTFCLMAEAQVR